MRALLLALLATTACTANKKENAHDPAPTAQRQADDKATEDLQAGNAAKVDVATAQATVDDAVTKAHAETSVQLQQTFDEADRRFKALEVKAASATGAARKRADAAVADVKTREASAMASIAKLRDASAADWNATKAKVDSEMVALNQSIDSLEAALK